MENPGGSRFWAHFDNSKVGATQELRKLSGSRGSRFEIPYDEGKKKKEEEEDCSEEETSGK